MPPGQSFPIQIGWKRGDSVEALLEREWLVTNGLGGYASGTIGGAATRRFHGKLIASLPAPLGRFMMLNHLEEWIDDRDGNQYRLSGDEHGDRPVGYPDRDFLEEFALDCGMPVWRFGKNGVRIEKRVVMPHQQNTTYIVYRLIDAPHAVTLNLRPALKFRPHEGLLNAQVPTSWDTDVNGRDIEICDGQDAPPLRLVLLGRDSRLIYDERLLEHVIYRVERSRGYEYEGALWSPGVIQAAIEPGDEAGIVASVETWDVVHALSAEECFAAERARRERLLSMAKQDDAYASQLVLAADQFLIRPGTRAGDAARAAATGDEPRTVIAGYHWFTDWGRDTMISLEGLTLVTNRHREAGNILRTFASYIRDGLIPNLFPEGESGGRYHTADASMWFFHAVKRYVDYTGDRETLRLLLPKLVDVIDHHVAGTRFNIHVDPADGLLAEGAAGYQLTWMDAKVGDWVVTPRRGKPVEINALYYNALRILQGFLADEGDAANARRMDELAMRARESFNRRFWNEACGCLFDVVDAEGGGDDPAIRPNQIFAVSLAHPVLDESRWRAVVDVVRDKLLTPVGLRSLSRGNPDYKERYDGDLRSRDAAYHQGTVWAWLIGPFIDAWLRVNPGDRAGALHLLDGFRSELGGSCVGTISEVFDAEPPFHPRGCAAQAWSVAEVLRCLSVLRK